MKCGRRTASVWPLLSSQPDCVKNNGQSETASHTETCELYYTYVNSQLTACIVQYGAVRVVDLLSLALHKKHYIVYFPHLRVFPPTWRLQASGCYWLHTLSLSANKVRHVVINVSVSFTETVNSVSKVRWPFTCCANF